MPANKIQVAAYMLVAFIAAFALFQANAAINLARQVDHAGDIKACMNENLIRSEANGRNAILEQTAVLVVDSLGVLSKADRPRGDDSNKQLREIADRADELQTSFPDAVITDCYTAFPRP